MEMNDYLLPCQRDVENIWERLDAIETEATDEHERACPHCAMARESLLALRAATDAMVVEDEVAEQPSPELFGRIMSAVRAEVRRGQMLDLATPEPGGVDVSEAAVAVVLRFAADRVNGVRARRCRVRRVGTGDWGQGAIEVRLSVAISHNLHQGEETLRRVREQVSTAAVSHVGLKLERLDLVVEDLYLDEEPGA